MKRTPLVPKSSFAADVLNLVAFRRVWRPSSRQYSINDITGPAHARAVQDADGENTAGVTADDTIGQQ